MSAREDGRDTTTTTEPEEESGQGWRGRDQFGRKQWLYGENEENTNGEEPAYTPPDWVKPEHLGQKKDDTSGAADEEPHVNGESKDDTAYDEDDPATEEFFNEEFKDSTNGAADTDGEEPKYDPFSDEPNEPPNWDMHWASEVTVPPPGPLLFGLWEEGQQNLLIGASGSGKGLVGCWFVQQALGEEIVPAIYDAENNPHEWINRMRKMGIDLSSVVYFNPANDLPAKYRSAPLWDIAEEVGKRLAKRGVGFVLVDSVMQAVRQREEAARSDPSIPWDLTDAEKLWPGVTTVNLAHTPKGRTTGDAFGSFAWTASHRITLNLAIAGGDGHRVRLTFNKGNGRAAIEPVLLGFTFDIDNLPIKAEVLDDEGDTRNRIYDLLKANGGMPKAALVEQFKEDWSESRGGTPFPDDQAQPLAHRIRTQLQRMRIAGEVTGPPARGSGEWKLTAQAKAGTGP